MTAQNGSRFLARAVHVRRGHAAARAAGFQALRRRARQRANRLDVRLLRRSERQADAEQGEFHRAGPSRAAWPGVSTEHPYQRPEPGPRIGPALRGARPPGRSRRTGSASAWRPPTPPGPPPCSPSRSGVGRVVAPHCRPSMYRLAKRFGASFSFSETAMRPSPRLHPQGWAKPLGGAASHGWWGHSHACPCISHS